MFTCMMACYAVVHYFGAAGKFRFVGHLTRVPELFRQILNKLTLLLSEQWMSLLTNITNIVSIIMSIYRF